MADFPNGFQIYTVAAQILDETDGQQAGAAASLVYTVQRIEVGEPFDRDTGLLQTLPGIEIGRKLLAEGHHFVARPPIHPHGNGGDAFRRILHDGDLAWLRAHHPRRGPPQGFLGFGPFLVMQASEFEGVGSQPLHGLRRWAAERRDGRMIQIDQALPDRELVLVLNPQVIL